MSFLTDIMNDIKSNPRALRSIGIDLNSRHAGYHLDSLRERFREVEWAKKSIKNNALRNAYDPRKKDADIIAALSKSGRLDSADGLVFARQLEEIDPRQFDILRKPLDTWKQMLPIKTFTPGTQRVTYRVKNKTGKAILSSAANVTETNIADVTASEASNSIKEWTTSYMYTASDLRKAALAQIPLETDKVMAVEEAYKESIQEVAFLGNSDAGLEGVFNHTGVTNSQVPAPGTGTVRTWNTGTDKTPDEIIAEISAMATEIFDRTRGRYGQTGITIALPLSQYKYIGVTPRSTAANDTTIMQYILKNPSTGISRFIPIFELAGQGTGSTDLAIAFPYDPTVLEMNIAEEIYWMPMQIQGKAYIFDSEMEFGGVTVRYPMAMTQRYGI